MYEVIFSSGHVRVLDIPEASAQAIADGINALPNVPTRPAVVTLRGRASVPVVLRLDRIDALVPVENTESASNRGTETT